jgi:hypothetical protein
MTYSRKVHGIRISGENGQGFLEYSVIIGLVMIIIISFVALFGVDLYNRFLGDRARASEQQVTQPAPDPLVEVFETGSVAEVFDSEGIRVENCSMDDLFDPNIERQYWLEYEIELGDRFPAYLRPQAITQLQTLYGFKQGSSEERISSLNLEAPPDSIVDYTIDWYYTWTEGNIVITQPDGSAQPYSYRVRVDIKYEILDIDQRACEPTPAP